MGFKREIATRGDYRRGFLTEGSEHYRREFQDLTPAIDRVKRIRDAHETATKVSNPNEWQHLGSVPMVLLTDWLQKNKHTMDQWARNDGGNWPLKMENLDKDQGVKARFLKFFFSRDHSKLHNLHTTTKRESSQILVPR